MAQWTQYLLDELVDHNVPSPGSRKKVLWKCSKCSHTWWATPNNRINGTACPQCGKQKQLDNYRLSRANNNPIPGEWQKQLVEPVTLSSYSRQRVDWQCENGHIWTASPHDRRAGRKCPLCRIESNPLGQQLFDQLVNPQPIFASSGKSIQWQCEHGHIWTARPSDRTRGQSKGWGGCPKCATRRSVAETQLSDFISSLDINVENNRRDLIPGEIDIYLPDYNMAVEYNGLYWHSEVRVDKNYHLNKTQACAAVDMQLFHIWEDDWRLRPDMIKQMLKDKILGRPSVGARHTRVTVINKATADAFLNVWHIQGHATGTNYTGLLLNDELVAVMVTTLSAGTMQLKRYASSLSIVGGMAKMQKWLGHEMWTTFANHDISNGRLYETTGWTKQAVLPPDYKYIYRGARVHKFNFRLKRFERDPELIFIPNKTEHELALLNNIYRVYDAGKTKYIKELSCN